MIIEYNSKLPVPKTMLLGFQHLFAMFGATILMPLIVGLSVQVTLVGVGVGTLLLHILAKGKVPVFLGSSFAFIAGIQLVTDPVNGIFADRYTGDMAAFRAEVLPYATGAIAIAGLTYVALAGVVKLMGPVKFMKYLPPIITAPTVLLIGVMLAPFAIDQSANNWILAIITLAIVVCASAFGKGMVRLMPILIGLVGAYLVAVIMHAVGMTNPDGSAVINFAGIAEARVVGLAPFITPRFNWLAIILMIPFAFATIAEHIGDMVALTTISGGKYNYLEDPGLHRTLTGDGLATVFSGLIGAPASTTYGENVGVVALTRNFNTRVVQLAAVFAIILGFSPIVEAIVRTIPDAVLGGASFMLYGMIAAVGIRNLVDARVDIGKIKNLAVISIMLVLGLGMRYAAPIVIDIGYTRVPLARLGIAIAVVVGVILNIVLPDENAELAAEAEKAKEKES
ncbi:MAG: uracil-xanthine permease [Defluviitaleaceae bacterium]|nr:uracil-xanthine permease [Defluviitaleaceae bacterium]